jgi:CRISPR-associated protein Cmr5
MATNQTLDQRRAAHAWSLIEQVRGEDDKAKKEFKVQVKKLPARIQAAGLGQALAFLEAKGYAPLLRDALAKWIKEYGLVPSARGDERLLHRVVHGDSHFLRFATAECLAYLQWVVRFAEAEFREISAVEE